MDSSSKVSSSKIIHLKDLLHCITSLKAIARDKLIAKDGWNSYDQVTMSIEESFQLIYLSHLCALAKIMIDILPFGNFICKMYYGQR